jgi:hypothetical protein
VLQRIFAYGSSCEAGMLQNRSGWISPEGYVRSWLKELQSPIEQHDVTAKWSCHRGSLQPSAPIKPKWPPRWLRSAMPPCSSGLVAVDLTAVTEKWHERNIREFRQKYQVTETATGFEIVPTMECLYDCICLPRTRTRWIYAPASERLWTLEVRTEDRLAIQGHPCCAPLHRRLDRICGKGSELI